RHDDSDDHDDPAKGDSPVFPFTHACLLLSVGVLVLIGPLRPPCVMPCAAAAGPFEIVIRRDNDSEELRHRDAHQHDRAIRRGSPCAFRASALTSRALSTGPLPRGCTASTASSAYRSGSMWSLTFMERIRATSASRLTGSIGLP